jgi:hypothetical protein
MTNEDLTRMAHEAGMVLRSPFTLAHLRDFADLVAAAEREAAATTAKETLQRLGVDWSVTEAVMRDIRARRTSTASPATLIDPRGSLGEPIV